MSGPTRIGWRIGALIGFLVAMQVAWGAKSGDMPDRSRGQYVHVLGLYPEGEQGGKGAKITPTLKQASPFSLRWTCGSCHDVGTIGRGWHFNALDPDVVSGRAGEPWIYADARLATQIPLSYRRWPGTWHPEQVGLDHAAFIRHFGRHLPGLHNYEDPNGPPQAANCLLCHYQHPQMDPGGVGGVADQTRAGKEAAALAATCWFARVDQASQQVTYDPSAFDDHNDVFLDLTKSIPNQRCDYCHSQTPAWDVNAPHFMLDPDVHTSAGMSCIDCHRHGLAHDMSRGYEVEALDPQRSWTAELTCAGCHLGTGDKTFPTAGRLNAPKPQHRGMPEVHFKKLTCTACHSGPWPETETGFLKTSRAHALGTTYAEKAPDALPRIRYPVYYRQADGRIAPGKLLWPAFWGTLREDRVRPLPIASIRSLVRRVIRRSLVPRSQGWPDISEEHIVKVLTRLSEREDLEGVPVYVCGGRLHQVNEKGELGASEHPSAQPCIWSGAHDVRPAAQALGVRSCRDCHDTDNPFFFGQTRVDSPLAADRQRGVAMVDWQYSDPNLKRLFGWTFRLRVWLKGALLGAALVLGMAIVVFGRRALDRLFKTIGGGGN